MIRSFFIASVVGAAFATVAVAQSPEELKARQCRSVHFNVKPVAEKPIAIYAEITPLKVAPGTYFCAAGFEPGYIGIQEVASGEHVVIFSVWDPVQKGDDHQAVPEEERALLIQKGVDVKTRRFGGEGTGGNSMGRFDWKEGETLRFLVVQKDDVPGFRQIAGYVYDSAKNDWKLISCWRTQSSPKNLSGSYSFVEDFMRNYESSHKARRLAVGPVYTRDANGKWVKGTDYQFTADGTPSENVRAAYSSKYKTFTLATGGETVMAPEWPLWETRTLPADSASADPAQKAEALIRAPKLEKTESK